MGASVSATARQEAALLEACADGDIEHVRDMIAGDVDIDCFDDEGSTPLHVAAFCGQTHVVRLILQTSTASLEAIGQLDGTPLHVACSAKRLEVVRLLLAAQACIDASDESGLRPLHRAAQIGDGATTSLLLAGRAATEATTSDGHTPLHVASMRGHLDVVEILLEAKARRDASTTAGETAAALLRRAAKAGNVDDSARVARTLARLEETDASTSAAGSPLPSPPSSPPGASTSGAAFDGVSHLESLTLELLIEVALCAGAPAAPLALGQCSRALRVAMGGDAVWQATFLAVYAPVARYCFGPGEEAEAVTAAEGEGEAGLTRPAAGEGWRRFVLRFGRQWMRLAHARRGLVLTVVHGKVYDVTGFIDEHPGDAELLLAAAGRDASEAFDCTIPRMRTVVRHHGSPQAEWSRVSCGGRRGPLDSRPADARPPGGASPRRVRRKRPRAGPSHAMAAAAAGQWRTRGGGLRRRRRGRIGPGWWVA